MSTQIASVKIGNLEWVANTLIDGFEITHDGGDRMGTARLIIQANPATGATVGGSQIGDPIGLLFAPGQYIEIYSTEQEVGVPVPPDITGLWGDALWGEPLWGAGEGGAPSPPSVGLLFSGQITVVRPRFK